MNAENTMTALVYTGPEALEIQRVPLPSPGEDEVLIRVAACGICGSDVHGYAGKSRIRIPPAILGHEFSGTVIGHATSELREGDRVVVQPLVSCGRCALCRAGRTNICPNRRLVGAHLPGAFAEYVIAPRENVYSLPPSLSDRHATFVEPLANSVHMLTLAQFRPYDDLVVLGAGPLGLLTVALARLAGARNIVVTDTQSDRLGTARRLGATTILDAGGAHVAEAVRDATGGGAGIVIEAVGISATRQFAVQIARPGGAVILLGNAEPDSSLPMLDVVNRELILKGSYSSTDSEFRRAIAVLADGGIELDSWSETVALADAPKTFERLLRGGSGPVKTVVRPPQ